MQRSSSYTHHSELSTKGYLCACMGICGVIPATLSPFGFLLTKASSSFAITYFVAVGVPVVNTG